MLRPRFACVKQNGRRALELSGTLVTVKPCYGSLNRAALFPCPASHSRRCRMGRSPDSTIRWLGRERLKPCAILVKSEPSPPNAADAQPLGEHGLVHIVDCLQSELLIRTDTPAKSEETVEAALVSNPIPSVPVKLAFLCRSSERVTSFDFQYALELLQR
jgi:hypothetical protein